MYESALIISFGLLWMLVVYNHALFPLFLKRAGQRTAAPAAPAAQHLGSVSDTGQLPSITLVIPAYNEADTIAEKISNIAQLSYPGHKLQLIIACDGCTDNTAEIAVTALRASANQHLNARLWCFSANIGKTALLNRVLPRVASDIIALSDASALISQDALLRAAFHFRHPGVGVVAGSYNPASNAHAGERLYWDYQRLIRQGEARLGAPIGVHGALWFMRREGFQPLEADTINDDFVLPMRMVSAGYKAVYDPAIKATETECINMQGDLSRRRRIGAGNLQQLLRLLPLLHPRHGGIALAFFSGKALRGVMPLLLALQLGINALLAQVSPEWLLLLVLQGVFISLAMILLKSHYTRLPGLLKGPCYLIGGYIAGFIGCIQYLCGYYRRPWQRVGGRVNSPNPAPEAE